jgi:hypothetical protein
VGQPVAVTERPGSVPGIIRFETNRNLTGMGHERFDSIPQAIGDRPAARLARSLFATGKVASVYVYGNVVSVELERGYDSSGLAELVENMNIYYTPGFVLPSFDDVAAPDDAGAADTGGAAPGGAESALSEAAKRVPAHLLERSRLARERWRAKTA